MQPEFLLDRFLPEFIEYILSFFFDKMQFCLEEEDVWRCVLAWAKHKAGVAAMTGRWTEEERTRVCQHLAGVINHVRLLLIGVFTSLFVELKIDFCQIDRFLSPSNILTSIKLSPVAF